MIFTEFNLFTSEILDWFSLPLIKAVITKDKKYLGLIFSKPPNDLISNKIREKGFFTKRNPSYYCNKAEARRFWKVNISRMSKKKKLELNDFLLEIRSEFELMHENKEIHCKCCIHA